MIQELCTINGFKAKVSSRIHGFSENPSYTITITDKSSLSINPSKFMKKIKPENNITWCIETEIGNFIARRKGTVFITGNCHNGHGIINTGLRTINNIIFSNATAVTDGEFSKGITYFGNIIEI